MVLCIACRDADATVKACLPAGICEGCSTTTQHQDRLCPTCSYALARCQACRSKKLPFFSPNVPTGSQATHESLTMASPTLAKAFRAMTAAPHRDTTSSTTTSHRDTTSSTTTSHRDTTSSTTTSHRDTTSSTTTSHRDTTSSTTTSHRDTTSSTTTSLTTLSTPLSTAQEDKSEQVSSENPDGGGDESKELKEDDIRALVNSWSFPVLASHLYDKYCGLTESTLQKPLDRNRFLLFCKDAGLLDIDGLRNISRQTIRARLELVFCRHSRGNGPRALRRSRFAKRAAGMPEDIGVGCNGVTFGSRELAMEMVPDDRIGSPDDEEDESDEGWGTAPRRSTPQQQPRSTREVDWDFSGKTYRVMRNCLSRDQFLEALGDVALLMHEVKQSSHRGKSIPGGTSSPMGRRGSRFNNKRTDVLDAYRRSTLLRASLRALWKEHLQPVGARVLASWARSRSDRYRNEVGMDGRCAVLLQQYRPGLRSIFFRYADMLHPVTVGKDNGTGAHKDEADRDKDRNAFVSCSLRFAQFRLFTKHYGIYPLVPLKALVRVYNEVNDCFLSDDDAVALDYDEFELALVKMAGRMYGTSVGGADQTFQMRNDQTSQMRNDERHMQAPSYHLALLLMKLDGKNGELRLNHDLADAEIQTLRGGEAKALEQQHSDEKPGKGAMPARLRSRRRSSYSNELVPGYSMCLPVVKSGFLEQFVAILDLKQRQCSRILFHIACNPVGQSSYQDVMSRIRWVRLMKMCPQLFVIDERQMARRDMAALTPQVAKMVRQRELSALKDKHQAFSSPSTDTASVKAPYASELVSADLDICFSRIIKLLSEADLAVKVAGLRSTGSEKQKQAAGRMIAQRWQGATAKRTAQRSQLLPYDAFCYGILFLAQRRFPAQGVLREREATVDPQLTQTQGQSPRTPGPSAEPLPTLSIKQQVALLFDQCLYPYCQLLVSHRKSMKATAKQLLRTAAQGTKGALRPTGKSRSGSVMFRDSLQWNKKRGRRGGRQDGFKQSHAMLTESNRFQMSLAHDELQSMLSKVKKPLDKVYKKYAHTATWYTVDREGRRSILGPRQEAKGRLRRFMTLSMKDFQAFAREMQVVPDLMTMAQIDQVFRSAIQFGQDNAGLFGGEEVPLCDMAMGRSQFGNAVIDMAQVAFQGAEYDREFPSPQDKLNLMLFELGKDKQFRGLSLRRPTRTHGKQDKQASSLKVAPSKEAFALTKRAKSLSVVELLSDGGL